MRAMPTPTAPGREDLADRVVRCIDTGDLRRALELCRELNSARPDYAYGWYLASFLLRRARNLRDALRAIERAIALSPLERYRLHHARCLFDSGNPAATREALEPIRRGEFGEAGLHNELGTLLHQLGEHADALHHYSRAVALDGANAEYRFNRGAVLRYLGEVAAAEDEFDAAIRLSPRQHEACNARAQLRRQTQEHNHVTELEALLARTREPAGQVQLHFALAKELEDLGEYPRSFAHLAAGAATKRRQMRYEVDTDLQIMRAIRDTFGRARFSTPLPGCDSVAPIFVIGMPRTGTTLVERILASHPQVESAGELNEFALELTRLVRAGSTPGSRTAFVAASAAVDYRVLGEGYLERTRALRCGRPHFIDKLPFNFLYAGLIHLALPNARIISLQRHPVDTCYAVFKQLFRDAYPFSYDLDELASYYIAWHELMLHWYEVMPGVIHTVRYETLVDDLEGETRRLLEFCALPWDEACLRFHENRAPSTTASATQVRQPIYRSSVAKWRHYARELEPLRARLREAGIEAD
jgi:tetratricopeptide (TPR) repeat protein